MGDNFFCLSIKIRNSNRIDYYCGFVLCLFFNLSFIKELKKSFCYYEKTKKAEIKTEIRFSYPHQFSQPMRGSNKIIQNRHITLLDNVCKMGSRTPEICPDFTNASEHFLLTEMHPLCENPTQLK